MLDDSLKTQLSAYLEKLQQPIQLVASLDGSDASRELEGLLQGIAALNDKVEYVRADDDARKPSFAIVRTGTDIDVRFAGIPMGHEFTSLVLALLWVGGHPPKLEEEVQNQVRDIEGEFRFERLRASGRRSVRPADPGSDAHAASAQDAPGGNDMAREDADRA